MLEDSEDAEGNAMLQSSNFSRKEEEEHSSENEPRRRHISRSKARDNIFHTR